MATSTRSERIAAAKRRLTEPPEAPKNFFADWAGLILVLLFGTTTIAQAFVVPTGSMTGTVLVGDHLIVDKLAYAPAGQFSQKLLPYSDVRRGDIIVFRWPVDVRETYVKCVIGIPGDRIRFKNSLLILNGTSVNEPYVYRDPGQRSYYLRNFPEHPDIVLDPRASDMLKHVRNGELVVPPGQYFALGDNRGNSADSRFWGFVPRENIIGKPFIIFWSYDAPTEHLANGKLNADHLSDLALHFFSKTRWDRTLKLVRGYDLRDK